MGGAKLTEVRLEMLEEGRNCCRRSRHPNRQWRPYILLVAKGAPQQVGDGAEIVPNGERCFVQRRSYY